MHIWAQVRVSLRTDCEIGARKQAVEAARELGNIWLARSLGVDADSVRFDALSALAASRGFADRPSSELAMGAVEDISRPVPHLRDTSVVNDPEINGAVPGGAEPPLRLMPSGTAGEFLSPKTPESKDKGRNHRRLWENAVRRSFTQIVDVVGDKASDELSCEDARAFRAQWP